MTHKNLEIIDSHISGDLSKEEEKLINLRLKTHQQFAKDYKLQLEINEAIKEKEIMELRESLNNIFEEKHGEKGRIVRKIFTYNNYIKPSIAAAVMAILIIGSILLFNTTKKQSNDQLFTLYYKIAPPISPNRSIISESYQVDIRAFNLYKKKQFSKAIEIFKKSESSYLAKFYTGISYIELGEYEKASVEFSNIYTGKNNLFTEDSKWYLGLCYLKLDKITEATKIFTEISNSNSINSLKAKTLLKSI